MTASAPVRCRYASSLLRRGDVAVGHYRDLDLRLHRGDGVVLCFAYEPAGASASVNCQRLDASGLRDPGHCHGVTVVLVPAGTDLERYRHIHCAYHGRQNASHQWFVPQQRGAGHDVADLLGRAAHIDVDDLCALIDVVLCGFRHHDGIGAGDLNADRFALAIVVRAAAAFLGAPQVWLTAEHLGHTHARAHFLAQLPEWTIGDPCHGRNDEIVREFVRADLHGAGSEVSRLAGKGRNCIAIGEAREQQTPNRNSRRVVRVRNAQSCGVTRRTSSDP